MQAAQHADHFDLKSLLGLFSGDRADARTDTHASVLFVDESSRI
jgi:hypothetical protein